MRITILIPDDIVRHIEERIAGAASDFLSHGPRPAAPVNAIPSGRPRVRVEPGRVRGRPD